MTRPRSARPWPPSSTQHTRSCARAPAGRSSRRRHDGCVRRQVREARRAARRARPAFATGAASGSTIPPTRGSPPSSTPRARLCVHAARVAAKPALDTSLSCPPVYMSVPPVCPFLPRCKLTPTHLIHGLTCLPGRTLPADPTARRQDRARYRSRHRKLRLSRERAAMISERAAMISLINEPHVSARPRAAGGITRNDPYILTAFRIGPLKRIEHFSHHP